MNLVFLQKKQERTVVKAGEEILSQQKAKRIRLLVNETTAFKQLTHRKVLAMLNENSICAYSINEITVFLNSPNAICNRDFAIGLASVLGFRRTAICIINEPDIPNWDNKLTALEQVAIRVNEKNTPEVVFLMLSKMSILRSYLGGNQIESIGLANGLSEEQVINQCLTVLFNLRSNCKDESVVFYPIQNIGDALIDKHIYLKLMDDRLKKYCAGFESNT